MNVYQQYAPEAISGIDIKIVDGNLELPKSACREIDLAHYPSRARFSSSAEKISVPVDDNWAGLLTMDKRWAYADERVKNGGAMMEFTGGKPGLHISLRGHLKVNTWVPRPDVIVDMRSKLAAEGAKVHCEFTPPWGDLGVTVRFGFGNNQKTGNPQFYIYVEVDRTAYGSEDAIGQPYRREWEFTEPAGWGEVVA